MQTMFLSFIVFLSSLLFTTSVYACLTCSVSTGVEKLKLADGEIVISNNMSEQCIKDANNGKDVICFPHSSMTLKKKGKAYNLSKIIKRWDEFFIYFVKIRKDKYRVDLNDDKRDEIAILPMLSGGGAHVLTAYIYTVMDEGLQFFGEGKFFWEFGSHVKFGCPQCWKYDLHKCDTCY